MKQIPKISITKINPLFTFLENQEINSRHFLENEGFDPSILDNPDNKISVQEMHRLIHKAAEITNDPFIGLHIGELFSGISNIVGSIIINCKNLEEAFHTCNKYQHIFDETKNSELLVNDRTATLTFSLTIDYYDQDRILSEYRGVATNISLEQLTGKKIPLKEIHFRHQKPHNISEYQRIFMCPIQFSSNINAVMFDSHYLTLRLKQPNPQLYTLFNKYAESLLKQLEGKELFSDKVKKIIAQSTINNFPGIKQVAQEMAISVRKLQVKLKEEGTSFSSIIDKFKEDLAIQYLQERNRTVNEVAFLLGFSEPSAFQRSFKRWRGIAPGEFRKKIL